MVGTCRSPFPVTFAIMGSGKRHGARWEPGAVMEGWMGTAFHRLVVVPPLPAFRNGAGTCKHTVSEKMSHDNERGAQNMVLEEGNMTLPHPLAQPPQPSYIAGA